MNNKSKNKTNTNNNSKTTLKLGILAISVITILMISSSITQYAYATDAPVITSLLADDPDNLDAIYSIDDTITITFDSDTNTPGGTEIQARAAVNDLFEFTELIGQVYRGQWTAPDTFTITINNANDAGPPVVGVTTVTPIGTTPILSADETSDVSSTTSPVLSGDFGVLFLSPPVITSLTVDDPDDLDDVYSIDDTIMITFDSDTNTPGGTGIQSKLFVDDLFIFTESIGSQYRGQWTSPDMFTITINGINNAALIIDVTTVTPTGTTPIFSADGTSDASSNTSPVLSGDFGEVISILDWIMGAFDAIYYTTGNVGIGTDNPTEQLQVDGNFKLNGNLISDGDICIGNC